MENVIQRVVCAGIVKNDGKILIVQRSADEKAFPNLWELPGGKREFLEKTEEAVKREVFEETGLKVEVDGITGYMDFHFKKGETTYDATQLCFVVKPVGSPEVKLSDEHQNFAWITEKEIDNYNLSKETKENILKAFKIK